MKITPVSIATMIIVGITSAIPSDGAQMTGQIRNLMQQKEEKVKKLEECDGKRKGWMIAGISTIGLTAVGVGVNIAQASKSNKLSGEIEQGKHQLERQQERLSQIEENIADKQREKDCAESGGTWSNGQCAHRVEPIEPIHRPPLDAEPDGTIGEVCDDGRGTWVVGGDNLCIGDGGLTDCHCEKNPDDDGKDDGKKDDDDEHLSSLQ